MTFATSSPGASTAGQGATPPICQNCTTSTTPLWRRDEAGSVLCNACGLFLKLHSRPRPISLKTDVIKSRNRVKNSGQSAKKKSLFDPPRSENGTPSPGHRAPRSKFSSGMSTGSASPQSRAGTPLPPASSIAPPSLFESLVNDSALAGSTSLPPLNPNHPSAGSTSTIDMKHLEQPQTMESLINTNNTLMTRVKELELVNDMFRSRVQQLETSEANLKRTMISNREIEAQLRQCIEDCNKREDTLKRKIEDLESELIEIKDPLARKKLRVSDITA